MYVDAFNKIVLYVTQAFCELHCIEYSYILRVVLVIIMEFHWFIKRIL